MSLSKIRSCPMILKPKHRASWRVRRVFFSSLVFKIIPEMLTKRIRVKRYEILIHTITGKNLEDITLREVSQTQKDKYCVISLIEGN